MGTFINCLQKCKWFQTFWKATWQCVINSRWNIHVFGLSILLQRIYPQEITNCAGSDLWVRCIALFRIEGEIKQVVKPKRKVKEAVISNDALTSHVHAVNRGSLIVAISQMVQTGSERWGKVATATQQVKAQSLISLQRHRTIYGWQKTLCYGLGKLSNWCGYFNPAVRSGWH